MTKTSLLLLLAAALMLSACGRGDINAHAIPQPTSVLSVPTDVPSDAADAGDAGFTGDAARGEALFNTMIETSSGSWTCASCHSTGSQRLVGPGLAGIGAAAGERVEGEDAVTYLRQSIVNPDAFIVPAEPAYPSNLMPENYGDVLTEQQINDLIAYLLSL